MFNTEKQIRCSGLNAIIFFTVLVFVSVGGCTQVTDNAESIVGKPCAVSFSANGAEGNVPDAINTKIGKAIEIPGIDDLLKFGQEFVCWNSSSDGTGTNFTVGSNFIPSGNIILYAKFRAAGALDGIITVLGDNLLDSVLKTDKRIGSVGSGYFVYQWKSGTAIEETEWDDEGNPVAAVLAGTILDLGGSETYTLKQSDVGKYIAVTVMRSSNSGGLTSYPTEKVEEGILVSFSSNGGGAVAPVRAFIGGTVPFPEIPTPPAGQRLVAWFKDTALTEMFDFSGDTFTQAATLYAKWKGMSEGLIFEWNYADHGWKWEEELTLKNFTGTEDVPVMIYGEDGVTLEHARGLPGSGYVKKWKTANMPDEITISTGDNSGAQPYYQRNVFEEKPGYAKDDDGNTHQLHTGGFRLGLKFSDPNIQVDNISSVTNLPRLIIGGVSTYNSNTVDQPNVNTGSSVPYGPWYNDTYGESTAGARDGKPELDLSTRPVKVTIGYAYHALGTTKDGEIQGGNFYALRVVVNNNSTDSNAGGLYASANWQGPLWGRWNDGGISSNPANPNNSSPFERSFEGPGKLVTYIDPAKCISSETNKATLANAYIALVCDRASNSTDDDVENYIVIDSIRIEYVDSTEVPATPPYPGF